MFGLVVRFDLVEGCEAPFDALTEETVGFVWACEPDTLVYACHRMRGQDRVRIFYELYRDPEAFRAHEQSPYVQRFLRKREEYLSCAPEVSVLDLELAKGVPGGADRRLTLLPSQS